MCKLKQRKTGKNAIVCEKENINVCKVTQVMQSVNCAPARGLKVCWWIAVLILREHTGMEGQQMNETWE